MLTTDAKQSGTIKKYYIEAPTSVKQVILETSQNSQENTYATVSFLIKLQRPATVLKKRPWHRCFPVNFAKYLRTPVLQNTFMWLLLMHLCCSFRHTQKSKRDGGFSIKNKRMKLKSRESSTVTTAKRGKPTNIMLKNFSENSFYDPWPYNK